MYFKPAIPGIDVEDLGNLLGAARPTDANEHLPTPYFYARECLAISLMEASEIRLGLMDLTPLKEYNPWRDVPPLG